MYKMAKKDTILPSIAVLYSLLDIILCSLTNFTSVKNMTSSINTTSNSSVTSEVNISLNVNDTFDSNTILFGNTTTNRNTTIFGNITTNRNATPFGNTSFENTTLNRNITIVDNITSIWNTSLTGNDTSARNITQAMNTNSIPNTTDVINTTMNYLDNAVTKTTISKDVTSSLDTSGDTTVDLTTDISNTTTTDKEEELTNEEKETITPVNTTSEMNRDLSTATSPAPLARRGRTELLRLENVSSEQRLMADLLWRYENSVRPVYNSSKSVVVGLGLTLTQILDLDEKNQVLTTNVWLEVEWRDEKLIWDKDKYDGTDSIRIPCRQIWLPDIVLYNSVDDYTSGYMPSLAMVHHDGRVFWGPVVRFRSSCKIDITYFPFDDQVCYLKLGSWAYNGFQVDATKRSNSIDLSNYIDNGEWELIGVKVTRNSVYYNCCKEPFPDVMFYMRLRRRVKYYFMNIIIPCIILSFLCLAGFLLPPESGEKITLGLSVLLTITVFMLMVADKMPQTSESISLISIYLMVVLSMSCLSILFSVGILSIHHQRGKPRRCPDVIKYIVFSLIAPILCLKLRSSGHVLKRNSVREKPSRPKRSFPDKPEIIQLDGRCELNEFEEEFETFMTEQSLPDFDIDLKTFQEKQNSVNELIQWLHRKHRTETIEDLSFQEWRDVAFVLDRLLFVLFLVVTVISTVAILSMRPEQALTGFIDVQVDR